MQHVLDEAEPSESDVVVISVNCAVSEGDATVTPDRIVDEFQTRVFSSVVYVAEKIGKPVKLLAVGGRSLYGLILETAEKLRSSRVVIADDPSIAQECQRQLVEQAWGQVAEPKAPVPVILSDPLKKDLNIYLTPRT